MTEAGNQREKTDGTKRPRVTRGGSGVLKLGDGSGYDCVLAEPPEGVAHALANRFQRRPAVPDLGGAPAHNFIEMVIHRPEEPALPVSLLGIEARPIGAPHHVGALGRDRAIVRRIAVRRAEAARRQQAVRMIPLRTETDTTSQNAGSHVDRTASRDLWWPVQRDADGAGRAKPAWSGLRGRSLCPGAPMGPGTGWRSCAYGSSV